MTRRRSLLILSGAGIATGAAGYAWRERRGVTRADFRSDLPPPGVPERLHALLTAAALAPSGHNTQPWTVHVRGNRLIIGSDPQRWLPQVDPANREMALSLGAFLENLHQAAPACGYHADLAVTGDNAGSDSLVSITLTPAAEAKDGAMIRIRSRRTVRNGQLSRELSASDAQALVSSFGADAAFFPPSSPQGRYLAAGTVEANQVQADRQAAQTELASWTRLSNEAARSHRDGLTQESMEIGGIAGWYVRHFLSAGDVTGRSYRQQGVDRVRDQVASCGGWLVICSPDSSVETLLTTGRRLERLWLGLRERGIGLHPMTQMLEERPFSEQLGGALGLAHPIQFLLRLGYVARFPDPVSLRRPVAEFAHVTRTEER